MSFGAVIYLLRCIINAKTQQHDKLSFSLFLVNQLWFHSLKFLVNSIAFTNNAVMKKSVSHLNAIVYS